MTSKVQESIYAARERAFVRDWKTQTPEFQHKNLSKFTAWFQIPNHERPHPDVYWKTLSYGTFDPWSNVEGPGRAPDRAHAVGDEAPPAEDGREDPNPGGVQLREGNHVRFLDRDLEDEEEDEDEEEPPGNLTVVAVLLVVASMVAGTFLGVALLLGTLKKPGLYPLAIALVFLGLQVQFYATVLSWRLARRISLRN